MELLAAAQRRAEQAEQQGKLHLQQLQHLEAQLAAAQADSGKHATVGELCSLLGSLEAAVSSGRLYRCWVSFHTQAHPELLCEVPREPICPLLVPKSAELGVPQAPPLHDESCHIRKASMQHSSSDLQHTGLTQRLLARLSGKAMCTESALMTY